MVLQTLIIIDVSMKLNIMLYDNKHLIENNVFAQILYDHVQYDKKGKE